MVTCEEAIRHIKECQEEICSKLRQKYNKITNCDQRVELLIDEDGLLPFSY
jgi:hypothetical protein